METVVSKYIIYGIWFPEANDRSVYIGLTKEPRFPKRCKEHLYSGNKGEENRIVYKWMHNRISKGYSPEFSILEHCLEIEASDKEVEWQLHFTNCGWKPKHQKGGIHQVGYSPTLEHRSNMSKAAKKRLRSNHSSATKEKISASWTIERKLKQAEMNKDISRRSAISISLKEAYKVGLRKPIENAKVGQWECLCGKIMRATSKGMHRKVCNG